MVSFDDIKALFSVDLQGKMCIEIEFCVIGLPEYQGCWMGKMPHPDKMMTEVYWFGLASDGSKAYDYVNFSDFSTAPVFDGNSLKEVWSRIEILSVDGLEPVWRINSLIKKESK